MSGRALSVGAMLVMLVGCGGGSSTTTTTGTWTATASMATARYGHTSTVLPSGLVLVTGGGIDPGTGATSAAELYDPIAGTWQDAPSMPGEARGAHAAVLLPAGVLVMGGGHSLGLDTVVLASALVYDLTTGAWSSAGAMGTPRWMGTATLLPSGKVLAAGGGPSVLPDAGVPATKTAELYDPDTNTWSSTAPMSTARVGAKAVLLLTGSVLVTGGATNDLGPIVPSAELYDPASGTWTNADPMPWPAANHSATLLPSGKVLVAGGCAFGGVYVCASPLRSAALYDPDTGTWSVAASMARGHALHGAALLTSGKVLVVAGLGTTSIVGEAELYDPATNAWEDTGAMSTLHEYGPGLVALPDGRALVTGGWRVGSPSSLGTAELFEE